MTIEEMNQIITAKLVLPKVTFPKNFKADIGLMKKLVSTRGLIVTSKNK